MQAKAAIKIKYIILLSVLSALTCTSAYAQKKDTAKHIVAKISAAPSKKDTTKAVISSAIKTSNRRHAFRDTLQFKRSIAEKHDLVLSDSFLNVIGIDSLLDKIENVHNTLNQINNTTTVGFNTHDIQMGLPQIDSNIDIIDDNVTLYNSVLDVKNLQMFDVLLTDLQSQLSAWRAELFKYNSTLSDMNEQMANFRKDTVLRALIADSAFKSLYQAEVDDLKGKWRHAKNALSTSRTSLSLLQANVSNQYFETIDLQNNIHSLLRKISIQSLGKEYDYLWNINSSTIGESDEVKKLVQKSYDGQQKILAYYFYRNWDNQLWMLLTGLVIFIWIFRNFRKLNKLSNTHRYTYIHKISLLPILIVLLNLAPLYDLHPPTAYVEIIGLLMVLSVTYIIKKTWPPKLFNYWLAISVSYIIFSFISILLAPSLGFRLLLLALNMGSVLLGLSWINALKKNTIAYGRLIRLVSFIYITLNAAAIFCNLLGRLSLAKIFSVTAVFSLTQMVGLTIFIQIITEACRLQINVFRLENHSTTKLNFKTIGKIISRALVVLCAFIWLVVFTISLNIYNILTVVLGRVLQEPRSIGSTTFRIGNILLFIFIIYISNLLQQGIGSLYEKDQDSWDPQVKKNGSRLAMTRLVLLVIGFLLAVAASGLPLDKITIVLGALGVGIGLGLQSIVNNLVSGVILIFEQPFRIGDFIELGDKKGRVLDIGIRSSKLMMEEGAEVILPNGDLLTGRVVNWTLRNDNARLELPLSVEITHTFSEVKEIILAELDNNKHVLHASQSEILLAALKNNVMTINVLVWIDDVHQMQASKSELLNSISDALTRNGIKMV